jgi:hypothetical protein
MTIYEMESLLDLPQEIIVYICGYLNFRDNRNLSHTCKYLYQIDDRKNINLSELKRNLYYLFGFNFCRNLCRSQMQQLIPGLDIGFFVAQNDFYLEDDETYLMIQLYDRFYDPRNIHYEKDSENAVSSILSMGFKWVGADMFHDFYSLTIDSDYKNNFLIFVEELFDKVYPLFQTFHITKLYSNTIFDLWKKIQEKKVSISNCILEESDPIQKEFDKIHMEKQKELSEEIYKLIHYFDLEEVEKYIVIQ